MSKITKQIAELCDGMDYSESPCDKSIKLAVDNKCIIIRTSNDDTLQIFGYHCALTEWCGRGEHDCYDGSDFSNLNVDYARDDGYEQNELASDIDSIGLVVWWCGETQQGGKLEDYSEDMGCFTFTVKDNIEHSDFKVLEDGDVYCTGKVIKLPFDVL